MIFGKATVVKTALIVFDKKSANIILVALLIRASSGVLTFEFFLLPIFLLVGIGAAMIAAGRIAKVTTRVILVDSTERSVLGLPKM